MAQRREVAWTLANASNRTINSLANRDGNRYITGNG
jgi:hypothetical protein